MPFDWGQLAGLIGGAGGAIGGNPGFARGFQRGMAELEQRKQREAADTQRQEQLKLQQNQDERAANADTRAQQNQYLQAVNSVRQLLGDTSIESPDDYAQRESFVMNLAPKLGVDTGFVQSLRPKPTVYTQRKLQKVYDQFAKLPEAERMQFEQGGHWEIDGQTYTPAQIRQTLGFGGQTATGEPFAFTPQAKPVASKPGIEQQYLDAIQSGNTALANQIKQAANIRDNPPAPKTAEGLTARQQQQVQAQARSYDTNQVVKNTQVMSEAVQFANGLDPNTTNPADDQALIYSFAKAMDPNSVVREGEYATVQKYAQSWAESFGFNAARIFSNTAFLTPQARQNMKKTIQARFRAAKGQYDVVRNSFVTKINKITGMGDGEDWLTDYGGAFPSDEPQPETTNTRATVTPPPAGTPARAGGAGPAGAVPNPFRR